MICRLRESFTIAIAIFSLSACGGDNSSNTQRNVSIPAQQPALNSAHKVEVEFNYQKLIDDLVSDQVHGIILHVSTPNRTFTGSSGTANLTTQAPLQPDAVYHLASTGKVFTALLAVQLHQAGLLDLDATIDTWLSPGIIEQIEHGTEITLRQLLNHSSGIYNYSDPRSNDAYVEFVLANYKKGITNQDLVQFALGQPAYFKPGSGAEYSNSNYALAGIILDRVLGHPNAHAMRDLIIDRLELVNTFSVGIENQFAEITPGYEKQNGEYINTWPILSHVTSSATPIASTVTELSLLMENIFNNEQWLSNQAREELIGAKSRASVSPGLEYVLGLWKEDIQGYTVYHHNGGNHGYVSNNLYIPELNTSVVYFLNCGLNDKCLDAFQTIERAVMESILVKLKV
ncbi:serine hydrolase domain-containing protein [Pseudoalteromonas luteoviolacea]|uniref:serine hydrolase domain-containing protein n=1 Tax=Pseudoalteromonas luteoviolacea TaxID=43657 RepID=UPI001B3728B2|nr:serine hydrolase domain-containing protein [Pseudoalteromonas luteoviolacea]MBQ4835415.1 beta-lactamase family protein [Pseudoalteromonas luteoviolacea]